MTAEGSINLQKVDTKVKDNDQNSDLTAKLKKKRQLPEVGGSSYKLTRKPTIGRNNFCGSISIFRHLQYFFNFPTKGQLISEWLFDVLNFQKTIAKIWWISALESKKWLNQKDKDTLLC